MFKDPQRLVQSQAGPEGNQVLQRLRDKPLLVLGKDRHGQKHRANKGRCCFNHIIGLPKKDGKRKPMFDYERHLYQALLEPAYLNSNPFSNYGTCV
jgi:hypothetical protein